MNSLVQINDVTHTYNPLKEIKELRSQCGFCCSTNMKKGTCKDCGTTAPNLNAPDRRKKKKDVSSQSNS